VENRDELRKNILTCSIRNPPPCEVRSDHTYSVWRVGPGAPTIGINEIEFQNEIKLKQLFNIVRMLVSQKGAIPLVT